MTQVGPATPARRAGPARQVGVDGDPIAETHGVNPAADYNDGAGQLMAWDDRTSAVCAMEHMEVGAADSGGGHLHHDLMRCRGRIGHFHDLDGGRRGHDGGLHGIGRSPLV